MPRTRRPGPLTTPGLPKGVTQRVGKDGQIEYVATDPFNWRAPRRSFATLAEVDCWRDTLARERDRAAAPPPVSHRVVRAEQLATRRLQDERLERAAADRRTQVALAAVKINLAYLGWPVPDRPVTTRIEFQDWHRECCALCGDSPRDRRALVIDHDHHTGLIRGVLCRDCNGHEGRHDTSQLRAYRAMPPARLLRWFVHYESRLNGVDYGICLLPCPCGQEPHGRNRMGSLDAECPCDAVHTVVSAQRIRAAMEQRETAQREVDAVFRSL